jgi:hypothetical protein
MLLCYNLRKTNKHGLLRGIQMEQRRAKSTILNFVRQFECRQYDKIYVITVYYNISEDGGCVDISRKF